MKQKKKKFQQKFIFLSTLCILFCLFYNSVFAQDKGNYVRIVNLAIDSTKLDSFKAALKADIEEAVRIEPGVLTLHAVYNKGNPTQVTVFEIYRDKNAHELHMQTEHFIKYKELTKNMVKSTERIEVIPIVLAAKPNL